MTAARVMRDEWGGRPHCGGSWEEGVLWVCGALAMGACSGGVSCGGTLGGAQERSAVVALRGHGEDAGEGSALMAFGGSNGVAHDGSGEGVLGALVWWQWGEALRSPRCDGSVGWGCCGGNGRSGALAV